MLCPLIYLIFLNLGLDNVISLHAIFIANYMICTPKTEQFINIEQLVCDNGPRF